MAVKRLVEFPAKTTPVGADIIYTGDSADTFREKKSTIAQIIQGYSNTLAQIAGITFAADEMIYAVNSTTFAATSISAFGRALVASINAVAAQTVLELVPGTDVQPYSAALTSIAGLTTVADEMIYTTAADTYAVTSLTALGRSIVGAATQADANTAIGSLPLAGGTMTGSLILNADPTLNLEASTKQYTDTKLPLAGGTMTGALILNADPLLPLQSATKQYVDSIVENIHVPADYATTANLAGYIYNNGVAGVGATLTAPGNGAFSTDGASPTINQRILVAFQTSALENGLYALTTVGDGSTAAVLTRSIDYDQTAEIQAGDRFIVLNGTSYGSTEFVQTEPAPITIGTNAINFQILNAGFLLIANNLSELTPTAATARANISAAESGINGDIDVLTMLSTLMDPSGDELLQFFYVPSAVNFLEILNGITGNGPIINATGDDATVPLNIGVKESFVALYNTTGVNTAPQLRFYNRDFTAYTGFKVADAATNSVDFVWPSLDGRSGESLITNGDGVLSFSAGSAQPNLVFAGNFDTNPWQRGTTFVATPTGTAIADGFRWSIAGTGGGVVTIIKTSDAPTLAEAGFIVSHCLHVDVTTADVAMAAGDAYFLRYVMEGYDFARIAQQAFTISFWVKSTITGEYGIGMTNAGGDQRYVGTYIVNAADTWEFKTIVIDASPAAGTWNYTDGSGLFLFFTLATGTTFQTTPDIWQNTTFVLGTSNQVNAMSNTANNFKLALVKIEPGSVATPYPIETESQVLARCQRYFYKTFAQGVTPAQNIGSNVGALAYRCWVAGVASGGANLTFPVTMRSAPTLTFYSPSAASANWYNATTAAQSGAASTTSVLGQNQAFIGSAQLAGDAANSFMVLHVTADASL